MRIEMPDVLIVGAGPTGLMLACLLARRGIDFRIIDASPRPPAGSRGKGLPICFYDEVAHARGAYHDGTLFIIRPDDYVGLATEVADTGVIAAYLRKIL